MVKHLAELNRFLDAVSYDPSRRTRPDLDRGLHPFVTISREYGAGGRHLAKELLEVLNKQTSPVFKGWKAFDRELCDQVAKEPELKSSIGRLLSEEYQSELEALITTLLGQASAQPLLIRRLFETIRTLATVGKVIIVGRAASCVTDSLPLGVHLRLTASEKSKIRRMKLSKLPEAEARKLLRKRDRDRARLVKTYFRREITDPALYDATWNTDRVAFETIATCTLALIEAKLAKSGTPSRQR